MSATGERLHLLGRVRRVDDDGVLGFVIHDEVGVVVGTANPCVPAALSV